MDLRVVFPDWFPPGLPPGGSPLGDAIFDRWLKDFVARRNCEILDRFQLNGHENPDRDPVPHYRVLNHLFKWLNGQTGYSMTETVIFNHRMRFCAIQFAHRRMEIIAEAERYVDQIESEIREALWAS